MDGIEALLFDVFGTVVDWRTSMLRELEHVSDETDAKLDSFHRLEFVNEWRSGYGTSTRAIAGGEDGPVNVDVLHREILDAMLQSARWSHLATLWQDAQRKELTLAWHKLDGWPDSSDGLYALKKHLIIAPLSNGSLRLLLDIAKHANFPWDAIFSTELFGTYKPNPKTYLGAAYHLSLPPSRCAMVAAHLSDLKEAASHGMKTVYVQRPGEDIAHEVKSKAEGGEVDLVVNSLTELASVLRAT